MLLIITATQGFDLTIDQFVDRKGNPAQVDGPPTWSVSDPAMASLRMINPDNMSCHVAALGPVGTFQLQVHADADLGPDEKQIIGTFDVEVVAGEAAGMTFSASPPAEEP